MEVITETEVLLNILQRQNSLILDMQKHIDSVTRDFLVLARLKQPNPELLKNLISHKNSFSENCSDISVG